MKTNKKTKIISIILSIVMLIGLLQTTALAEGNAHSAHSSYVTHVEAVEGNCTTPGNIEFWYCCYYSCEKCYTDEEMTQEISPADVVITPGVHSEDCVGCEYDNSEKTFDLFVPSEHPYYNENKYINNGLHILSSELDGFKFLFVGEYEGKLYAMGNETNEDGSRPAIDLSEFVGEDGSVTVDSDTVEFFTFKETPDTYILSPDNGYMTALDGKIVVYGENMDGIDTSYSVFPQSIRFEQDMELGDYAADKGYLFGWSFNSPLILFDESDAEPKFITTLAWSVDEEGEYIRDENGFVIDNRAHNIMLYMERCKHPNMEHTEGLEATCEENGAIEHWYCDDCKIYFANAEATEYIVLPDGYSKYEYYLTVYATGHEYGDDNYCDNCGEIWHPDATYVDGEKIEPTCFEPGKGAYWLCEECGAYLDESKEHEYWEEEPAAKIPATGHAFNEDTGECDNCGLANPVYTKITSLDDINEEDLYIYVANVGDKYFVLGGLDEDAVGEPNEDGNEQGIIECGEGGNAIEVIPNEDGSISLLNQNYSGNAVPSEFMIDVNPEQWDFTELGLTTIIPKLPNYCVYPFQSYFLQNTGYIGVPRYADGIYGRWDASAWIIDFYTKEVNDDTYRDDMDGYTHAEQVARGNIGDNIAEGDLLMYSASFNSVGGAKFTLRFREYVNEEDETEYYFICGEDWALAGSGEWDYATDTIPTNDTQYAISIYRYDVPTTDTHTCKWTDWTIGKDEATHVRNCTDPECGNTETNGHEWDEGVTSGVTCDKDGITTYTCTYKCGATKEETAASTGHKWSKWADGGKDDPEDSHYSTCENNCGIDDEKEAHKWSDWEPDGKTGHVKICPECEGSRSEGHNYDDGVITENATHTKEGTKEFTCDDCGYKYTESVPKTLDHEWSDWEPLGDGTHKRTCACEESENKECSYDDGVVTENATHTKEGTKEFTCTICGYKYTEPVSKTPDHEWSDWKPLGDGTHKRTCACEESENKECSYDDGVVTPPTCTEEGKTVYTCSVCDGTKTETEEKLGHDWTDWKDSGENAVADIHIRSCKREGCKDTEDGPHEWSKWATLGSAEHKKACSVCSGERTATHSWNEGEVIKEATTIATGTKKYTCADCEATKTEIISKIKCEHTWGKWAADNDDTHTHVCVNDNGCEAFQRQAHTWNEGEVTTEPTENSEGIKTYTCLTCSHEKTEAIAMLQHEHKFGDWASDGEESHSRKCGDGTECTAKETENHSCDEWTENADSHTGRCSECGEELTEAHKWSDWEVLEDGSLKRNCTCCDATEEKAVLQPITESVVIATSNANAASAELKDNAVDLFNSVLTEEEQGAVTEGATVSVYLEVQDIPVNEVSASDKAAAEAVISEEDNELDETTEIGMYLDIELFKEVTSENNTEETQITETSKKVTITITIPDELINTKKSVDRTYRIIRVHEDENGNLVTDVIEGVFDSKTKTFTFESDKFSTYALAYNDESAPKKSYSGGGGGTIEYTVSFETNGGTTVTKKTVERNDKLIEPSAPTKDGYKFDGWYEDKELEKAYDFGAKVTKNFTLYAKWTEIEKENEKEPEKEINFTDVKADDWFFESVSYVVNNKLMNGVAEDKFAPDDKLTRAMLVTILYRAEGEPATNRSIPFADVDMGAYYANAVSWAKQNGIVNGVTENEFAPEGNITREQIATIIFRYAIYKGMDAVTMAENLHFDDAEEISEYAISAMNWAVGKGLMKGKTETTINPKDNATRAEIATILQRFIEAK